MSRYFSNRLQLQLLLILMAAIAVATLSVLLIWDTLQNAERAIIADMSNQLTAAVSELAQRYPEGERPDPSGWPLSARDRALRGISQTVLLSYRGAEGGYFADSQFLGYSPLTTIPPPRSMSRSPSAPPSRPWSTRPKPTVLANRCCAAATIWS